VKILRFLKFLGLAVLALVAVAGLLLGVGWLYFHPSATWTRGFVYGQRHSEALTLDVLKPAAPNGLGVLLMVSGSWKSGTNSFQPWMVAPLLRRGYTVLPVYHVSQPRATVMETFEDVSRATRFIRAHAADYGIDPDRLGVTGGSAGGHLSLMLATRGGPGPAEAREAVDRASSAVQAVAIFYPVTDLLNLGNSTENLHDGGPPKSFVRAFAQEPRNLPVWRTTGRELSPIYHVTSNLPPTLIYHGDADTLVPLDQSERFQVRAQAVGRTVEVVKHPGGQHGWLTMPLDIMKFADWFDAHLRPAAR
jgi:acetyl esterase/lipase